jgi:ABC-type uncharacterized transport system substrate-binding protein
MIILHEIAEREFLSRKRRRPSSASQIINEATDLIRTYSSGFTESRSFLSERKRIVELASEYRLPAIYFSKEYVDEGGLMSYGVDFDDLFQRATIYVDKILKGVKPADLPVQQATKFEFVINLKAANQIGLTIPVNVLEQANQVIKRAKRTTRS